MGNNRKSSHSKRFVRRRVALFALVGVVLLVAVLEFTNQTHFFHKRSIAVIPSTPDGKSSTAQTTTSASSPSQPPGSTGSQKRGGVVTTTTLAEPFGTFVSNHTPGKDGAPTHEESVCNTTPGASCYVQFAKGDAIRKLDAQVVDSTGAAYWSWDVNDAKGVGLTTGSWKVSAVATLDGQTKTSNDVIPLEIQP
jgi:hypothetical protein